MSSWRREVNCDGKKPGKYFCRKLKMRTWPTGVSGAIRMMAKGMNVRRSLVVRRSACTCVCTCKADYYMSASPRHQQSCRGSASFGGWGVTNVYMLRRRSSGALHLGEPEGGASVTEYSEEAG